MASPQSDLVTNRLLSNAASSASLGYDPTWFGWNASWNPSEIQRLSALTAPPGGKSAYDFAREAYTRAATGGIPMGDLTMQSLQAAGYGPGGTAIPFINQAVEAYFKQPGVTGNKASYLVNPALHEQMTPRAVAEAFALQDATKKDSFLEQYGLPIAGLAGLAFGLPTILEALGGAGAAGAGASGLASLGPVATEGFAGALPALGAGAGQFTLPAALAGVGGAGAAGAAGGTLFGGLGDAFLAGAGDVAGAGGAVPAWAPLTQTGTTFATGSQLGPALLEAAQLASQGLSAAEMVSLGVSPQIAQAAASGLAGPLSNALQGAAVPQIGGGNMSFLGDVLNNVFGGGTTGGGGINWGDIAKTALQAGLSLYSGGQQADAAQDAAFQQRLGAQAAIDEQRRQFDVNRADLQPWLRGGQQGLTEIMQMLGIPFNPVTGQPMELRSPDAILQSDPEYKFQLGEGMRALERSSAATTGTLNPRAVKALQRYGQGLASNTFTNRYNRLAALSGLGQATGQSLGTFGQANAANVGNLLAQQGTAASAGTIGAANAKASGLEGVAGAIGQYGQNRQIDDILRRYAYSSIPQLGGL